MSHEHEATGARGSDSVTPVATPTLVKGSKSTRSTIALKLLMAVTGLIFVGFVLLHMYGNLKAFAGHDAYNEYAHHLRTLGEPMLPHEGALWIIRVTLVLALVLHVYSAVTLWRRAAKARTVMYVVKKHVGATFASRMMRWGGVTLLLFIIWHLLNFTIGKVNVDGGPTDDPFNLMVDSFQVWWLTLIYLVALAFLGAHLHHGIWSAAQTLGFAGDANARDFWRVIAFTTALFITLGFAIVPLSIAVGIID